ncbi:hypothetical protein [Streptomyces sp. 142MFCol3.1]|uniref:hypothetical protein n=1 Tax=Streptomyces sp. 142MFCol3.1 TaxID=1172179 RepID=UPI00131A4852|nr:hypothetical protein [Streptomyces sp. 142MFCol3.1]
MPPTPATRAPPHSTGCNGSPPRSGRVAMVAIAVGPDADRQEMEQIARGTDGSGHQVGDPSQIHSRILTAIMAAGSRS